MRYRFDRYEFNCVNGELRAGGVILGLQAQPAKLLAMLIERAGETVTRPEIQDRLWAAILTSSTSRASTLRYDS